MSFGLYSFGGASFGTVPSVASGKVDYTLTCAAGAYSLAANAATLTYVPGAGAVAYVLTCDAGAYVVTGQAATFNYARSMAAAAGSYAFTGIDATFQRGYALTCDAGAYVLTGQAAQLQRSYALSCAAGAYALSGGAATLLYVNGSAPVSYVLTCDAGAYVISGQDAALSWSGASQGAGRKRKFQVETDRGIIEVESLDDVAELVRRAKAKREKVVEVKLEGLKVATPSTKPNIDYKAIEAKLRASIQAEMDEEDDILMLLL